MDDDTIDHQPYKYVKFQIVKLTIILVFLLFFALFVHACINAITVLHTMQHIRHYLCINLTSTAKFLS